MGWCIANLCSGDDSKGCSRATGRSFYMECYVNSTNQEGYNQIKKFTNYLDEQNIQFSKFIKYNDNLDDDIKIYFRNKNGKVNKLFQGSKLYESDYEKIYNKINL